MNDESLDRTDLTPSGPRKPGPKLCKSDRAMIAALILQGIPKAKIARDFDISRVSVGQIAKNLQKATKPAARDWKEVQKSLAIHSVNRALLDGSDTYKSANVGVKTLEGLGEYTQHQAIDHDIHVSWDMPDAQDVGMSVVDITPEVRQINATPLPVDGE